MQEKKIYIDEFNNNIKKMLGNKFTEREKEFESISKDKPSLIVWRIESLKLKKWPESSMGVFFEGDSFLVLNFQFEEKNIHVWIGSESTRDEMELVSFKALQLDDYLDNNCTIFYENQGQESKLFLSYFPYFYINKGGIDGFLNSKDDNIFKAKLIQIHGKGSNIQLQQVPINQKSLCSTDSFLLDIGTKIFLWKGKESSGFEMVRGTILSNKIKESRGNKLIIVSVEENSTFEDDKMKLTEFENILGRYEENMDVLKDGDNPDKNNKKMMKLSDEKGKLELNEVEYGINSLFSNDSFLIDRGDAIVIWVGKQASKDEKRYGRFYANRYINKENRNKNMPIYIINEGKKTEELQKCFL